MKKEIKDFDDMKQNAQDLWDKSQALLGEFGDWHTEIDRVRLLTRQLLQPITEITGKRILTAQDAASLSIILQTRSFFDRAVRDYRVVGEKASRDQDAKADKCEKWLEGFDAWHNQKFGYLKSDAIYHGLESGLMVLGTRFNPYKAAQGEMGLRYWAQDPRGFAYSKNAEGLSCAVTQNEASLISIVESLQWELSHAKQSKIVISDRWMQLAQSDPFRLVTETRYYDDDNYYVWIENDFVLCRPHGMCRVPFDIARINDVPSVKPFEAQRGMISPIRSILENKQTLIDIFTTNAELYHLPLGLVNQGGVWKVEQLMPGKTFDAEQVAPIAVADGERFLQTIAQLLNNEVQKLTLPDAAYSAGGMQVSGYALAQFMNGLETKLDLWKRDPERALSAQAALLLDTIREYANPEMANVYCKAFNCQTGDYLDSFAVLHGDKVNRASWWYISSDDVPDHVSVEVVLSPRLPKDEPAVMQQYATAVQNKVPVLYAAKNFLKVDDYAEFEQQYEEEFLLANNPRYVQHVSDQILIRKMQNDKEFAREWLVDLASNGELTIEDLDAMVQGKVITRQMAMQIAVLIQSQPAQDPLSFQPDMQQGQQGMMQDPSMMQQGMMQQGQPDMTQMLGAPSQASAGLPPPTPDEMAMMQQAQGGMA